MSPAMQVGKATENSSSGDSRELFNREPSLSEHIAVLRCLLIAAQFSLSHPRESIRQGSERKKFTETKEIESPCNRE